MDIRVVKAAPEQVLVVLKGLLSNQKQRLYSI